jgi:hypothetical protein
VRTGRTFEIPFQGGGWIYTGEENSRSGINYDSRRVDNGVQTFTFRAEREGDYALTFYRQDFLRDYYTNELVKVIVRNDAPESTATTPITATPQPETQPPPTPSAGAIGAPAVDASAAGTSGDEDYLQLAREAVAANNYPEAISLLDRFRESHPAMNDEAWWLYGQSFEAASSARDIKSALDAYSCLTREYPQSRYYGDAQNRIAFLNRFYFNIR